MRKCKNCNALTERTDLGLTNKARYCYESCKTIIDGIEYIKVSGERRIMSIDFYRDRPYWCPLEK